MKIGFIGAGKVGCTLGLYLGSQNEITGYASRSKESAEFAAKLTGSKAYVDQLELCKQSDIVYITTPDGKIEETWNRIRHQEGVNSALRDTIVAHASGSLSSKVFEGVQELGAYAVSTHPLFAIPSKTESAAEIHKALIVIEGSKEKIDEVSELFRAAGSRVQTIPTEQKTRYHAAAVLASNHVVALYNIALAQLEECGFEPREAHKALSPLFLGNAQHIVEEGPILSLTGPAERNDEATISKHLGTLEGRAREVYELLNEEALDIAQKKRELLK